MAEKLAKSIASDLAEVGVRLNLKVFSSSDCVKMISIAKITKVKPDWDGQMAISMVDNPIKNTAFH